VNQSLADQYAGLRSTLKKVRPFQLPEAKKRRKEHSERWRESELASSREFDKKTAKDLTEEATKKMNRLQNEIDANASFGMPFQKQLTRQLMKTVMRNEDNFVKSDYDDSVRTSKKLTAKPKSIKVTGKDQDEIEKIYEG